MSLTTLESKKSPANRKFDINSILYPALSIVTAALIRTVPVVLAWPYPTGFDTNAYYLPRMIAGIPSLTSVFYLAQLHQFLLSSLYALIPNTLLVLDLFAIGLQAAFSLVFYLYARDVVELSSKISFVVSLIGAVNLLSLRLTWDQYRMSLGLVFSILAFVVLARKSKRIHLCAIPLVVLTILSNQVPSAILLSCLFVDIIRKRKWRSLNKYAAEVSALIIGSTLFLIQQFPVGTNDQLSTSVPIRFDPGVDSISVAFVGLGFLLFSIWPFLALLPFNRNHIGYHHIWLYVVAFFGFVIPLAGIFILAPAFVYFLIGFPLVIICGLSLTASQSKKINRASKVAIIISILISASYLLSPTVVPSTYSIIGTPFDQVMPSSYLQSSVPISQENDLMNVLSTALSSLPSNSTLYLPDQFYGLSFAVSNPSHVTVTSIGIVSPLNNSLILISTKINAYTIWWTAPSGWYGIKELPSNFRLWLNDGVFSVYKIK